MSVTFEKDSKMVGLRAERVEIGLLPDILTIRKIGVNHENGVFHRLGIARHIWSTSTEML